MNKCNVICESANCKKKKPYPPDITVVDIKNYWQGCKYYYQGHCELKEVQIRYVMEKKDEQV